jgi:hypothetical protein
MKRPRLPPAHVFDTTRLTTVYPNKAQPAWEKISKTITRPVPLKLPRLPETSKVRLIFSALLQAAGLIWLRLISAIFTRVFSTHQDWTDRWMESDADKKTGINNSRQLRNKTCFFNSFYSW